MLHFRLRARKHLFLLLNLEDSGGRNTKCPGFRYFVSKDFVLCFKKVVRLDGCVAFSEIKPRTPILEWEVVVVASFPNGIRKSRKYQFFPLRNGWFGGVGIRSFPENQYGVTF